MDIGQQRFLGETPEFFSSLAVKFRCASVRIAHCGCPATISLRNYNVHNFTSVPKVVPSAFVNQKLCSWPTLRRAIRGGR